MWLLVLIVILEPWLAPLAAGQKEHDIYIAGFFPLNPNATKGDVGIGVLPAVKLAIHDINRDREILKDYKLHIIWNNTQCDAADGMKLFFDMMYESPRKVMLFGDACKEVTDPIAKASRQWKIAQLSYGDMHPMFSQEGFPNLFRIVPSENEFNAPRIELLKTFNWTRVGTLFQNLPEYSLAHNRLVKEMEEAEFEIDTAQSFADDITYQLHKLKEKDIRIILGNFNETWARRIFCEAYREKLYGKKYQWLIVAAYNPQWWRKRDVNCTEEEVETALKGALLMDLQPLSSSNAITISGNTASEYKELYEVVRLGAYSRFHGYAYDGIWAIALALHNISKYFPPNDNLRNRKDLLNAFRYHDENWEKAFLRALEDTKFNGVTGPVQFRDNGRKGTVLIKQFQAFNTVNAEVKVGEFDGVTQTLNLSKGKKIVWNGKNPPKDKTIVIIEHTRINITLFAAMATASSVGILLACFFLAINIRFRNQRYIKMSSPYLNNLIIIGCMFTYTSVIILGLDSKLTSIDAFPYICTARAWVLMAGFTLAFGSMFSKTWRVHSIFTNVKLNKKVIKDMQLFIVVGILLAIDFAIMTTWHFIDPMYRETKRLEATPDSKNDDILIIPEHEFCKSQYMSYFVGSIYAYKGLLMMFGCFLAWETRHVSIPALNDSKYIGMSVYNSVMMCLLGAPLSHVLSDKQDACFLIISAFIIFCTTATLCLVFLPKVIELKRNPKGNIEKRLRTTIKPPFGSATRRPSATSIYENELKAAKQDNQKIRKQIREVDSEIQALAKILGDDAQEILHDAMHNLAIPKSEVLKKEDTDVSSLYSLNSDGGEDVFIESPLKKAMASVPWEGLMTSSVINSAKTILFAPAETLSLPKKEVMEEKSLPKIPEEEQLPLTMFPLTSRLNKSEYDIIHLEKTHSKKMKGSSSESQLGIVTLLENNSCTTQEEIWAMLRKERRYLDRNLFQGKRKAKSPGIEKKSLSVKKVQEEEEEEEEESIAEREILFSSEGDLHPFSSSTGRIDRMSLKRPNRQHHHLSQHHSSGDDPATTKLSKYRSYSVPRRLDNSLNFSEINLDVSLLPIFQKILSERKSVRERETRKDKSFMVSCPNILIKCDIVEYL